MKSSRCDNFDEIQSLVDTFNFSSDAAVEASAQAIASAAAASGSASSALLSAGDASNSALSSQASFNNFSALFLGAKNSPPATDNQGGPLLAGALYYNTADDTIYAWSGAAWTSVPGDSHFLGGYSSAPTVNNQGGPLQSGDAYWNTTSKELFIRDGAAWKKAINIIGIGQEFSQNNAIISRLGDKILVGGATEHAAAFPAAVSDWFGSFQKTKSLLRVVGAASSGQTTLGSPVVTFTAGGTVPEAGRYIFAPAIPPGAKILTVDSSTQITLDQNATSTASGLTLWSNRASDTLAGTAMGQVRAITNTSPASAFGGLFASQTQHYNAAGTSSIGIGAFAVNNNASLATNCWGGYFEAFRLSSSVGGARGIEIDVVSTSSGEIRPDAFQQSQSSCLQLGAGNGLAGELPDGVQVNVGAAIQIVPNPRQFRTGIVFLSNSIEGADGYSGSAPAIRFGTGHSLEWHNPARNLVARVLCASGLAGVERSEIRFVSSGVQFLGAGGPMGFINNANPNTIENYWVLAPAVAGSAPALQSTGTDTNVDLRLVTKGTGLVRYGTHQATADAPISGFIEIKDSAGTIRKLAVIS